MPELQILLKLFNDFGTLSLQAIGGGTAVLPEMQRVMQGQYQMSPAEFTKIYSLGQLAPGPNMTMVVVFGDRIAGIFGALVVLFAFFVPAALLVFVVGRVWVRAGDSPWRRAVQDGLAPISIGLMLSGVYALATTATTTVLTIAVALVVVVLMLRTKINPVFFVLVSAIIGGFFLPRNCSKCRKRLDPSAKAAESKSRARLRSRRARRTDLRDRALSVDRGQQPLLPSHRSADKDRYRCGCD